MAEKRKNRDFSKETIPTNKHINQILPKVLQSICKKYQERGDLVLAAWPSVIGPKLAPMTQAISFKDGFLSVKVNNSTLYTLLNQYDKPRLIKNLRDKFPSLIIKSIVFQLG